MSSTSSQPRSCTTAPCDVPRSTGRQFFWSLLQVIPAAQASIGDEGEADYDIQFSRPISDALHSGDGALGEALRPMFIEYLRRHAG